MITMQTEQGTRQEEKISRIVKRVLNRIFGKEATNLIYRHLETKYSLEEDKIASRIDVFAKGLEDFLSSGAQVIEQEILEDIYSSYGLLRQLQFKDMQEDSSFVGRIKLLVHNT